MKQYVEINVIREQIGERFGFPIEDVIEDLPIANDVQEKKYCKMIPLEPDLRNCTNVFICTNCHQHIYLGFIRKKYSGSYCLECGAEVKDGEDSEIPVLDHIPEGFEIFELEGLNKKYLALKTACPFCTHCTDVFYDWSGPYMWLCNLNNNCAYGMSGECKDFKKE